MSPKPSTIYSLDTSGLFDGLERFYPQSHFPALWERVDELISDGRLLMSEEAWSEATKKDEIARQWCEEISASRIQCVRKTNATIGAIAGSILADFPYWARLGHDNEADPFVIAVAEVHQAMVITGEKQGGPGKPKIPYVCERRNVKHGRFVDLIKNEGWIFG